MDVGAGASGEPPDVDVGAGVFGELPDVEALYLDEAVALLAEAGYGVSGVAATAPPRQRGGLAPNQRYRVVRCSATADGVAPVAGAAGDAGQALVIGAMGGAGRAAPEVGAAGDAQAPEFGAAPVHSASPLSGAARGPAVELVVTAAADVGKL
ncbi:MAG: hypothetical protein LBL83_03525 [Clostridiales bacterium]|nr:hypothetical protein [Clostridiales bacterium]